jgi:hypothetical protein
MVEYTDKQKVFNYTYKIDLKFFVNGEKDPFSPIKLRKLKKRFNYYSDFFPIFEGSGSFEMDKVNLIFKNQNNIYCSLEISQKKYNANPETTNVSSNIPEEVGEKIVLSHVFIPFFPKSSFSPFIDEDQVDKNSEGEIFSNENQTIDPIKSAGHDMTFAMYSCDGINANKQIINAILGEDVDVATAVRFLVDQTTFEEAIIDKPDNEETYKTIILPPHNVNIGLQDLQVRYGVFSSGIQAFYDPPVLYIIQKYKDNHDYKEKYIFKTIFLLGDSLKNPKTPSEVEELDDDETLQYYVTDFPEKLNEDVYNAELLGNALIFTNYGLGKEMINYKENGGYKYEFESFKDPIVKLETPTDKHEKTNDKIIYHYDELNNVYNMAAFAKAMCAHTMLSFKRLSGINYEGFAPNCSIQVKFQDTISKDLELGGVYGILAGEIIFETITMTSDEYVCAIDKLIVIKE